MLLGERDGMTPFSRAYFKTLNNSVMHLNPAAIRQSGDIMNDSIRNRAAGLNESTFSVGADIMAVMRPKNGVKIRKDKFEFGRGKYMNDNPRQMSLDQYGELAEQHKSLANMS